MKTQMLDTEPTSGFIEHTDIVVNGDFTEFTNVRSNGFCLLTRAKRNGRWWMLKGLKEPYRQDSIYRLMLQKEFEIASQLFRLDGGTLAYYSFLVANGKVVSVNQQGSMLKHTKPEW